MGNDLALNILLNAKNNTAGAFGGASSGLSSILAAAGPVGATVAAVSAVTVGLGVASVKMAADYQQSMNMVKALTGSNDQQMQQYDASVKKLAMDAGVGPTELSKGLYNVLSASYKGADAVNVLTLATEDSKIGMTNATVTTDALTNVLRTFGVQSKDITRTNGEMLTTVTLGKATFEQYASTIVKSASSAAQFHVSMETMNAAWATMTSSGIRAAQASTDFQQSLKVMYGNIGTVTKSLHKSGIAFDEAKFNSMSYGDKVVYLNKALEEANAKHVKVTGVTLQAAQAISTIASHIHDYNSDLATLSNKQAMAMKTQEAWAITQSGFNQTMSRLKATLDVVMISIGQQLLPVITQFANQMIPIVANIGKWIVESGALSGSIRVLSTVLILAMQSISAIVSVGASLASFFQKNEVAGALLKGVLVGIAAGAIAFVATTIPALVAGFGVWAVAAGAAALTTLAAAAPFIAIGAVVAVVVAGIILAVQHWGQITTWLRGVWSGFTSWFMGMWNGLGAWYKGSLASLSSGFQAFWNGLVSIARVAGSILLAAVTMPITSIVQLFSWLYNHNYYFKDLVDSIRSVMTAGLNWLESAWKSTTSFLAGIWQNIVATSSSTWSSVSSTTSSYMSKVQSVVNTGASTVATIVKSQWNQLTSATSAMWNTVVGLFSAAWGRISGPLASLGNGINSVFSGLVNSATQWGRNLISGFVNGILSMAGAVGNAASTIAGSVSKFLGFHSPAKEGPGSTAHTWAPNLIKMFIGGIKNNKSALEAAMNEAAGALSVLNGGTHHAAHHRGTHHATHHSGTHHATHHAGTHHTTHHGTHHATHHSGTHTTHHSGGTHHKTVHGGTHTTHHSGGTHHHAIHGGNHVHHHAASKHSRASSAFSPVDVSQANGVYSDSSSASAGIGGGSSITINNYITVEAKGADANAIAKQVINLLTINSKLRGNLITSTSGGRA